jgi:hypothetical protein
MLPFAAFGQRASIARLRRSKPSSNHLGVDLIFDALTFRRLWYGEPNAVSSAIDYAKLRSRSSALMGILSQDAATS